MYIADMHCDSLLAVGGDIGLVNEYNFSSKYPQLQFVAEFCPKRNREPSARRRMLVDYLNTYLCECDRLGLMRVSEGKDVFGFLSQDGSATLLSVEGGGGLFANSTELELLYGAGLRVMGLAWDDNELSASAFSASDDYGLTEEGVKMVKRCAELGIILDASHLSDRAFYDTLREYPMPILATHSNFRALCDVKRNLTLDMARHIATRGGVIGINIYPEFLKKGTATADDILRHVEYGLENLGEDFIGFGFDIDGIDSYPVGISDKESIHEQVISLLLSHYSSSVVEKIAGLNVLEFLKNNLS